MGTLSPTAYVHIGTGIQISLTNFFLKTKIIHREQFCLWLHIIDQAADEKSMSLQGSALALLEGAQYPLSDTKHILLTYFWSVDQDSLILGYLIKNLLKIVN